MEGKTGFDVAEYLREVGHTPFMFLSAFSDEETVAKVKALGALDYLVKPLEVGQIVPAVNAAFARLREASAAASAAAAPPAPVEAVAAASPPLAVVPLAVGVLMHRFSLGRGDALARLRRTAASEGRSLQAQAERVVQAVEDLAGPAA
jgi:response regulator NasT